MVGRSNPQRWQNLPTRQRGVKADGRLRFCFPPLLLPLRLTQQQKQPRHPRFYLRVRKPDQVLAIASEAQANPPSMYLLSNASAG
jgi:hypothetical protein